MKEVHDIINEMRHIVGEITETATDVNKQSHKRKELTNESTKLIDLLKSDNDKLKKTFDKVYQNLNDSLQELSSNSEEFKKNIEYFTGIIENINNIKKTLDILETDIAQLTTMVNEIKEDTDEIFSLALNASIVSSKYTHTSGVFDILADKLNEMSNFIDQNLTNIVQVVRPITDGINKLTYKNALVLSEIEDGYESFIEFPNILDGQKESIDELLLRAYMSGTKIDDQKTMLEEIKKRVEQMDTDANGAITGSANVRKVGEDLVARVRDIEDRLGRNIGYKEIIDFIKDQSVSIWQSAQNVNEKSKTQRDFSLKCVDFCDSIISESEELKKTTETFNSQSANNNKTAEDVSDKLTKLNSKLDIIDQNIADSNKTIKQFNENYTQIDNIVAFLKNILKQMNVIGMYSRIESARDPDEFAGFITISDNIRNLQNHIHKNIPLIEENIINTQKLIEDVNYYFDNISQVFIMIANSSINIIGKLKDLTRISSDSEKLSNNILTESKEIENKLNKLRNFLIDLTEVVRKPIEGSAKNIERGKDVENYCIEVNTLNRQKDQAEFEAAEQQAVSQ